MTVTIYKLVTVTKGLKIKKKLDGHCHQLQNNKVTVTKKIGGDSDHIFSIQAKVTVTI